MAHTNSYPRYTLHTHNQSVSRRAFSAPKPNPKPSTFTLPTPTTLALYIAVPVAFAAAPSVGSLLGYLVGLL